MSSVSNVINNMQNSTAVQEANDRRINGSSNELNQDMFLKLMLEQLKYQDPMNPMDNQEFLAQQAQFTQLTELQKLNESISGNNTVMQAVSLIGKEVTLIDPNNSTKTITGIVEEAVFDANGSAIKVNGKNYPLSLVQNIREAQSAPSDSSVSGEDSSVSGGESETTEGVAESSFSETLSNWSSSFSKIAQSIGYISSKIAQYIK